MNEGRGLVIKGNKEEVVMIKRGNMETQRRHASRMLLLALRVCERHIFHVAE